MDITYLSRLEFERSNVPLLFTAGSLNRKFAKISNQEKSFLIAWQSDLIVPKSISLNRCEVAVGIDQSFGVIDFCSGGILNNIELSYNFSDVLLVEEKMLIFTELEVLVMELGTWRILTRIGVPDLINSYEVNGNELNIECFDGKIYTEKV